MIVEELVMAPCSFCEGRGAAWFTSIGPADNMDIDHDFDTCLDCNGTGWDDQADYMLVDYGEDNAPPNSTERNRDALYDQIVY